ncbi:MAG TPA: alanine/glycine:cation symporter family protein [Candidatus Gastranaerophilaceae bacterium]|nr:alanine/glycine:cation symporter family protein [Candidatus Gastranaerophilaceae bacterium]HPT41156.1 alanine/glycine:cation symporter family protein [Candidatus Gastranaerophilaceae bacterium]
MILNVNLDAAIDNFLSPVADKISALIFCHITIGGVQVQLLVALLMFAALYFTIRTRFIGFWGFKHALNLISNKYKHPAVSKKKKIGEVSSFQALSATISASAGMGNIAGTAAAISLVGPGVLFWMILAGLFSMALKFSEVLLGIKLRKVNPDGTVAGGPMYYILKGLKGKYLSKIAPHLAKIYAICCVFAMIGGWNLFQINAMTTQITEVTGGNASIFHNNGWALGLIVALIIWFTIIGGIKSIGKFTEKVTPVMCSLYLLTALVVCLMNFERIPYSFVLILKEAFKPQAVAGGMFVSMLWGFRRAMFSNEAGLGTASIAFSAVKTSKPVAQAFIAMLQPFVDTVIVGSATALVIIVSGEYLNSSGLAGIELTSRAFGSAFSFFPLLLTVMVSCFVTSTLLCGSYYGLKAWHFLFGESGKNTKVFQVIYCVFIILGSAMNFKSIINVSDAFTLFLAVPNLFAVFVLSNVVIKELKKYCRKYSIGIFKEKSNEREIACGIEAQVQ